MLLLILLYCKFHETVFHINFYFDIFQALEPGYHSVEAGIHTALKVFVVWQQNRNAEAKTLFVLLTMKTSHAKQMNEYRGGSLGD